MNAETFKAAQALIYQSMGAFGPEIVLSLGVVVLLMHDLFVRGARPGQSAFVAAVFLAVAGVLALVQTPGAAVDGPLRGSAEIFGWLDGSTHKGMLAVDNFAQFFKLFVVIGTLITIPMCLSHRAFQARPMGEFYALLLAASLGMFLMASATNLLMVYMGIEFASMASYLAVAFVKRDAKGSEAGLKYVIYGSVASGIMIYGMSLLYGMTGSLHFSDFARTGLLEANGAALSLAGVLIFAGFAYKMAAFPMHFWCPDVYEGAPLPFTAYLSVTSKAAGFAVFIRFLFAFGDGTVTLQPVSAELSSYSQSFGWKALLAGAAAMSMFVGNMAALWQDNLKRLLAYSSIAHAGYLLMGVAALASLREQADPSAQACLQAILFYLVAYLFMNLGAFYIVNLVAVKTGREDIDGYRGLLRRAPALTVFLGFCLISLLGLPPTFGFLGKLQLFQHAISAHLVWLAVVAGINTAISAYYYLRLIKVMCLDEAPEGTTAIEVGTPSMALVAALAVPVVVFGVLPNLMLGFTQSFGL